MAKTTSQIIEENKRKRAEEAAIEASRGAIHQKQMASVADKATARTQAVLQKALAGTTDASKKAHLNSAIRLVAEGLSKAKAPVKEVLPKTADGMQKRKEDQMEEKSTVDYAEVRKKNAEKALADYDRRMGFDDRTAQAFKKYDDQRNRLQMEANRENDKYIQLRDTADIEAMSEEERQALEQYAVNRVRDQNLPLEMQGMMPTARQEAAGLIGKYGARADELAETFMRQENAELAQQADAAGRKFAEEKPVLASAATIPVNLMAAITGTVGQLQGAARATGRYSSLDANETGTALDTFSGAVRDQVSQDIEGEQPNALRKGASWLYQGGMSFADSMARLLASGGSAGISSAIAASGAFSQGLQKYSAMGASPEQAALAATASAGLEYITEKLPTEKVLKIFQKGGNQNAVKEVLKQAFLVEPAGEEVNLFAGMAAEALILGENSSKQQRIGDLIAGGMTKAEAEKQFWKETFQEAVNTYAVSGFAGLFGGGAAAYAGNQVQTRQDQQPTVAPKEEPAVAPVMTEKENVQNTLKTVSENLQEKAPASAPSAPMTEQQKQMQQAIAEINGMNGRQELPKNNEGEVPKIRLYRGFNHSGSTTGKNLTNKKNVWNILGKDDPNAPKEMVPLSYYTESIEDAEGYAKQDLRYLDMYKERAKMDYRDSIMRGKDVGGLTMDEYVEQRALEIFQALHGGSPNSEGYVKAYDYTPGNVLDLTSLGNEAEAEAIYKVLGDALGIKDIDTVAELPIEPGEKMAIYRLLRNSGSDNLGSKITDMIRNAGYDSIRHMEDGYGHYVLINDHENGSSRIAEVSEEADADTQSTNNSEYYDEFEDFNAGGTNREDFLGRDWDAVGKKNVKAYMYEHPEVKPFFQSEAQIMLMELADTTRGERYYNEDVHYESGGESGWGGVKRSTSDDIAYLLDTAGFSYDQIQKGLEAIVHDKGAENNATSKRIEFILHNRLMNGHNDFYSNERVPASDDYVNLINEKQITTYDTEPVASASNVQASASNTEATTGSPPAADNKTMPAEGGQPQTVTNKGGQQVMTGFANRDFRASNTYMNSGLHSENANIRKGYRQELRKDPGAALYGVKHNADTLAEAQSRTGTAEKNAAALDDLLNKDHWTPEDVATSTLLLDQIMASGDKAAIAQLNALRQKRKEAGTYSGQVAQAFAINNPTMAKADSPATAVDSFRQILNGMKQEETTWSEKTGVPFEAWKEQLQEDVDRIGIAIATVEDGDSDSMRQIIRQIAGRRKTTAWFGTSDNLTNKAWGILKNLEFEDLKKIANTQLVAMADDYRARSKGEILKGLRKQSMLSSLKSFTRNVAGNTVGGIADSVSESFAGRMMDTVLSKFTGKRTVGNDLARTSTYAKAAKEAGQFASLCVELNIPIETDVESSYAAAAGEGSNSKYLGKTFRATGNPAMRALYAYQKYMSYALEVTDKVFEGGSNAAVAESLNRLQGANLTQEEMDSLGKFTANKRTFKDATWESTEMVDGKEKKTKHGSELARFAKWITNPSTDTVVGKAWDVATDIAAPFPGVPMNVAQTGIDYTAGVAKGLGEMVSIIKDAKAGKTIPVERQRQAASDFGRGVTGTAMIGLFASAAAMGALKASNSEDWDKEALAQAEGRSGAQINWSALVRGLNGEDAKWESGDVITGMDFLEPFNTQMYLGAELAQAEDINLLTYAGSTIKSVWQSLMDSPVMTGLADIEQTLKDISEAETLEDQLNVGAGYAGDVASSFVPQFVRQAAQNQDGYYRDTRGDTALESAMNSFMAAIPGLSKSLPKKYSGLGEEQKRGSAVETFLDPTGTRVYEENEVTTFLDELSGRVKDKNIDIYPDRQAPMRITVAGREVALDGSMRETYQKTYGEAVNDQYRSLMGNQDFQSLSDELKAEALKAAKDNAKKLAMAAVSDYKDAPAGSASQLAKEIVNKQVRSQISDLFSELDTATEYGYSTKETAAKMDAAFDAFQDLSKDTQKQILEQATGDTARYLQARQGGISTDQYLTTTQRIGALGDAKQPQKLETIAKQPGLTEDQRVLLAKLYASDAQDKNIDEVKAMGYNYATYTRLYNDHENYTKGTGKKKRTIAHWQEVYGFDYKTAKALYEVFS